MVEELTTEDEATLERLRRLAYLRQVDGGTFMGDFEETHSDETNRQVFEAWLRARPADLEMFCRLAASSYRLCTSRRYNEARAQVAQDFTTNRVRQVRELVERVPEILELLTDTLRDNAKLTHTLYVLSQLLPAPAAT